MSVRSMHAAVKTSGVGAVARFAAEQIAIAVVYLVLAKLGLALASINASATPIWPPTGFAIAALLLWGQRSWPAIFIGALIANALTAGTLATSTAIAAGNTLEAVVIAHLVRRWSGGPGTFDTPFQVVSFASICGATGTVLSATVGMLTLGLSGLAAWRDAQMVWFTWWLGDLAGALVIAPLVILWVRPSETRDWRGALVLYAATVAVGLIAFSPLPSQRVSTLPLSFLAVLPLVWGGLRHGRRETMTVAVLLSGFALWGVLAGGGPFVAATLNDSMLRLTTFMIATTVPSLALAAEVRRRRTVEVELLAQAQDRRAMFDQALVGIVETDPEGRILTVNERFCEIMGRPATEVMGRRMQEFTDPDDLTRDDVQFRQISIEGGGFSLDKRYMRPDGSRVWVRNNVSAITDSQGKVVRLLTVSEDVTERRRHRGELESQVAERTAALFEAERNLRLLIESVTDYAIYMLDRDGRVSSWNAGAQRVKGYVAEEVLGRHLSTFYTEEDRAKGMPDRALATARERGSFEGQGWRVRKDGSRFWADVVLRAIKDETGELIGFAKVTRDITERRRVSEALEEAREQLFQAQKLEAVGQLTGGVAHDFNNILAVILSGVALIERHLDDEPRVRHVIDLLRKTAHRGEGVINQLLTFSRRAPTQVQVVDAAQHIKDTIGLLDQLLGKAISVDLDLPSNLRWVEVDPGQFDLAVLNICLNARDAMPRGGKISVTARNEGDATGGYVAIEISDTGDGMTDEVRARAFEPFFTTKEVGKGSGLGLSQAYGFAQSSRGEITLDTGPGRGTKVTLRLPATTPEPKPTTGTPTDDRCAPDDRSVLVIEDDASLAVVTQALIEDAGYPVTLVHTAAEALDVLRADGGHDVAAVFSDVVMPGEMNGFDLARAVRREFPSIPILLTSGYSGAAEASASDGVRVIPKPYEPDELLDVLAALISGARPIA